MTVHYNIYLRKSFKLVKRSITLNSKGKHKDFDPEIHYIKPQNQENIPDLYDIEAIVGEIHRLHSIINALYEQRRPDFLI